MNIKEVKDLIYEVLQSDISEFELEEGGTRVRLKRGFGRDSAALPALPPYAAIAPAPSHPAVAAETAAPIESSEASVDNGLHIVTSPIVGTFYRSPSPAAEPFVNLGDQVEEGSILCLVEAMKLMNEIPSDIQGDIARIYVENSRPVEFGQKLFGIRPRKQG